MNSLQYLYVPVGSQVITNNIVSPWTILKCKKSEKWAVFLDNLVNWSLKSGSS